MYQNKADPFVLIMNSLKDNLMLLINKAKLLGLGENDIDIVLDFLENREYGLCLDTQLYEYNISIDLEMLLLIEDLKKHMKIK